MAGQIGLAETVNGGGTGTVPADMQRFFGALFENAASSPVINGGVVSGRSDMRYGFTAGCALIPTSAGAIVVTWPAGITAATSAPASGSETDVVYVVDYTGPKVGRSGTVPANASILDMRRIASGTTSTAATTSVWNRVWAISRGQGPSILLDYRDTTISGTVPGAGAPTLVVNKNFYVPYDMNLIVDVWQNIMSVHDVSMEWAPGSLKYKFELDGVFIPPELEISYSRMTEIKHFTHLLPDVSAGTHNFKMYRWWYWGLPAKYFAPGGRVTVSRESVVA